MWTIYLNQATFLKKRKKIALTGIVLGLVPQNKKSLVQFLVRAHAWVAGSVPNPGAYKRQIVDVSLLHQCFSLSPFLSPSLPLYLKNKFKNLKREKIKLYELQQDATIVLRFREEIK